MYNWWTLLNAGSDPWKHRTQPWQKKLTEKCGKHNHHDNTKIAYFDIYLKFEMWRLIKLLIPRIHNGRNGHEVRFYQIYWLENRMIFDVFFNVMVLYYNAMGIFWEIDNYTLCSIVIIQHI